MTGGRGRHPLVQTHKSEGMRDWRRKGGRGVRAAGVLEYSCAWSAGLHGGGMYSVCCANNLFLRSPCHKWVYSVAIRTTSFEVARA